MYNYYSNGFYFETELEFPELISIAKLGINPIKINIGKVPKAIQNIRYKNTIYQVSDGEFLLDIKNVARYLLKDKSKVIIDPYPNANLSAVRIFIISIIFSVIIYKHDMMAIHACSVINGANAVLFAGESGAGKSTIALGLHSKNYDVLNDDITTVSFDKNGIPFVHPGNARLRLWPKSLQDFGFNTNNFQQIRPEIEKFSFPLSGSLNADPIPLKVIFFIVIGDVKKVEKIKLSGIELFEYMRQSTFSYKLIEELGKTAINFKLCDKLANQVPAFKIIRPVNIDSKEFVDYLIKIIP